jgi:hypothetical protein
LLIAFIDCVISTLEVTLTNAFPILFNNRAYVYSGACVIQKKLTRP